MNRDAFVIANSLTQLCVRKTEINILFAFVTKSDVDDISLRFPQVAPFLRALVCELAIPNFLIAQHLTWSVRGN